MQSNQIDDDIIERFDSIMYKNKLLIANENPYNREDVEIASILNEAGYRQGEILEYRKGRISSYSYKRYLDDIDYIRFLNKDNS